MLKFLIFIAIWRHPDRFWNKSVMSEVHEKKITYCIVNTSMALDTGLNIRIVKNPWLQWCYYWKNQSRLQSSDQTGGLLQMSKEQMCCQFRLIVGCFNGYCFLYTGLTYHKRPDIHHPHRSPDETCSSHIHPHTTSGESTGCLRISSATSSALPRLQRFRLYIFYFVNGNIHERL